MKNICFKAQYQGLVLFIEKNTKPWIHCDVHSNCLNDSVSCGTNLFNCTLYNISSLKKFWRFLEYSNAWWRSSKNNVSRKKSEKLSEPSNQLFSFEYQLTSIGVLFGYPV